MPAATELVRYQVTGMDCPSCAAKISNAVKAIDGISDVDVSIASGEMALRAPEPQLAQVEQTVSALGYRLTRGTTAQPVSAAYRRALWAVVVLNAGYGAIEIIGGFIAGSQALKADALDFIGDGVITWLGLLAIGWGLAARAKAALLQGLFLGALGLGVLATTAYRVIVLETPQAELMGILGLVALAVNVLAAVILIPHRHGDANARAVWLFSRNDAIGNIAVVVAAFLVAWTAKPWPDLVVAGIVAGLFLQSACTIVRAARQDLHRAQTAAR